MNKYTSRVQYLFHVKYRDALWKTNVNNLEEARCLIEEINKDIEEIKDDVSKEIDKENKILKNDDYRRLRSLTISTLKNMDQFNLDLFGIVIDELLGESGIYGPDTIDEFDMAMKKLDSLRNRCIKITKDKEDYKTNIELIKRCAPSPIIQNETTTAARYHPEEKDDQENS